MACLICKGKNLDFLFKKKDFLVVRCWDCGLVQLDNIANIFNIDNYQYYKNRVILAEKKHCNPYNMKRYINLLNKLERYRQTNALLDIGCGEGDFLSVAKRMNWQANGLEIAPYAIQICKKLNLDVEEGDLLKLDLKVNYYDIVTMFEVLEHFMQPKEYLQKANYILRKRGLLIITTPNFNCLTRIISQEKWRLFGKEHLSYFTPHYIKKLLKDTNFKIIEFVVKDITLPELRNPFVNKNITDIAKCNQDLREAIEKNKILLFLKEIVNSFLNLTRLGESIQCICQKL